MKEKLKLFTLTTCGILFACILYQSYHFDNIFQIFFYIIFGGIGLFLLFNGIFNEVEKYKKTTKLKSFTLTFVGIILVILNCGIFSFYEMKLNAQTLVKTENKVVYADFKRNGEYIIKSGSWASKKYFYGNYSIKDSIINLDRKEFDNILISNKFVIRKIASVSSKNRKCEEKNYLVQLDQNGMEIKNKVVDFDESKNEIYDSFKFGISEDNRK